MNLPAVLDVAIGLIVLYFLLSTVCSFGVELIASWFWWRKLLLYKTIARLLTGHSGCKPPKQYLIPRLSGSHPDDSVAAFWNHPLARALAPDGKLPSYIEPSTFAAIVIDLAVPGATTGTLPATAEGLERVIRLAAGSADEQPYQEEAGQNEHSQEGDEKHLHHRQVRPLRRNILVAFRARGLPPPSVQPPAPLDELRKSIEKWYNQAMDRSTGEYKRKAQGWLLALGFVLAVACNADTIRTAYVLSANESLRNVTATYAATLAGDTNAVASSNRDVLNLTATNQVALVELRTNLVSQLKQLQELQRLGFPLGWTGGDNSALNFTPYQGVGTWKYLIKLAGLLATALAVSLGAPFWFDLLNKLVSLRGSGNRISTSEPPSTGRNATEKDKDASASPSGGRPEVPPATAPPPSAEFATELADARPGFHPRKAYWLAETALLAYSSEASVRVAVQQWDLELAYFFDKVQACQGFLAVSKSGKFAVLAFRGTEKNLEDWTTDAEFKLVPSPVGPGMTHEGFTNQLNRVYDELAAKLKEVFPPDSGMLLYITGHSLGAALGTLMAARLAADKTCGVHAVHTFGSPRVGDRDFAKNYELILGHCTYRIVNAEDLVTRVPPRIIAGTAWHYDHVGQVVFFDSDGRMKLSAGFWERFLNTVINAVQDFRNEVKTSIKDHSMELYVRLLRSVKVEDIQ